MDLVRLNSHQLARRPIGQRLFALAVLTPGFNNPFRPTQIRIENLDRLPPRGGSYIVMNHTDRYTCWPFQYRLVRELDRYAAVWVKAKYYQNPAMAWILDRFNNIPIPSMGYLLVKDFETACSRAPEQDEYELLKSFADGALPEAELRDRLARRQPDSRLQLSKFLHLESQEGPTDWRTSVLLRFDELMREVVRLNQDALALGLDIIVFPQGTRSKRISRGFTGAAQMILATGAPVLPVGASGVDRMFPGGSPLPSAGVATFRIGELLRPGHELKPFEEGPAFIPFTPEAKKQEPRFQALTDLLMDRINNLVDPEYQRDGREQAKTGVTRFV